MRHKHPGKYRSRTPRGYIIYKNRPLHKISKEKRKLFTYLNRKPYETGGYVDFDKKDIEQVKMYYGDKDSVEVPVDEDFEVEYHIHPKDKTRILNRVNKFPSNEDILEFKKYPTQSMMIFQNDEATIINKKGRVNTKNLTKINRGIYKDANKLDENKLLSKYKPEYKKMGLDINIFKKNETIKLPINVVEPINKEVSTKKNWAEGGDWDVEAQAEKESYERERDEVSKRLAELEEKYEEELRRRETNK